MYTFEGEPMDLQRSEQIVSALKRKKAVNPCPRCGHMHFSVVAETGIEIQSVPSTGANGVVPVVVIACDNCGYLTQHALAALNLLPPIRGSLSLTDGADVLTASGTVMGR